MPNTRAMRAANAVLDADNQPSDVSDREDCDEATEQSPERAPEPVLTPERTGANTRTDTETFLTNMMESFAKMQAETNRSLAETLRSLPYISGPWQSPLPASTPTPNTGNGSTAGNFAKCTARFNGTSREPEVLEAFIDAVQVYKECADVSDAHALRGLPMLLEGDAAVWWRGARTTVTTWKDAVARLRSMYGMQKPAYKILREVFSQEQKDERAEVFMCKVRSLIVKLPYEVPLPMQIDIIYGLLHRRIRKRLQRGDITDIDSFVEKARVIEDAISEVSVSTTSTYTAKSSASSVELTNVSRSQVVRDRESFDKTERTPTTGSSVTTDSKVTSISNENPKREKRVRCTFCKFYGHNVADCRNLKNKQAANTNLDPAKSSNNSPNPIRCYGCGQAGVVRSKCEHCLGKSVPPQTCDFNILSDDDATRAPHASLSSHPTVSVNIAKRVGVAILDTGANCSVAGTLLYNILVSEGVQFCEAERTIGLADGSRRLKRVLIATVPVFLEGRQVDTEFLVLPEEKTKTLLGRDFIAKAGVTLDLAQESWYFSDNPEQIFPFVRSVLLNNAELMQADISDVSLRDDEGNGLPPEHRDVLNAFLNRRSAQFAADGPPTDFATHKIKVSDDQEPLASPPYRLSPLKKEALEKELQKLLSADVIEECESPWASNVVLVSKKDGSYRLCVDYRKLNAVTEPDRYPLPRIEDVLHAAKTSKYMTTLDLRSGYFQVGVDPAHRDLTSFTTPLGTFRFKRMPMGLRNSGATFQRLIDRFKSNLPGITIVAYLDDLLILSEESFEKHLADLEAVFDRLAMFNLRVNREKSHFARESVKFLGHVIVPGGIHMDPDKTSAIANMSPPQNVKHLKCFLQTSSWFRRFIPGYAAVSAPLTSLLKKASTWKWGPEQQTAFETIKSLLVTAPILRQADATKPFVLRTDSSGYAIGAVLLQGEGIDERPVEYASRLLTSAEKNYNTTEREALAVVWATSKFRGYIDGSEVVVKSDHQPLRWLMGLKSPSGRLARWALTLQGYNLKIEYTPGKANVIADTLSRPACPTDTDCDLCLTVMDLPSRSPSEVRENQLKDPEVRKIIDAMESDDPFRGRAWADKGYVIADGVLYRCGPENEENDDANLVVPEHERKDVLAEYHDAPTAGHFGVERTLQRLSGKYYWVGMRNDVSQYIKNCVACQRYKVDTRKPAGLLQVPATSRRFEVLAVDLFGPLPETPSGNKWILILEDTCTKWVELFALPTATAEECAKTLVNEVYLRYGVPRRLISDNGVQFVSEVMQQTCHVMGIKQSLTSYYHPESNPVERKNRDLKPQLAILVGKEHDSWDVHLPAIRFAMNSAVTASTGQTPAYLNFGREIRAPADVLSDMRAIIEQDNVVASITPYLRKLSVVLLDARDIHERAQVSQKKYADEKRRPVSDYKVGDLVLLKTQGSNDTSKGQTAKFIPRRDGPYRIKEVVGLTTYALERISDGVLLGKYHVSLLTPFVGSMQAPLQEKRKRGRPRKANPAARAQRLG